MPEIEQAVFVDAVDELGFDIVLTITHDLLLIALILFTLVGFMTIVRAWKGNSRNGPKNDKDFNILLVQSVDEIMSGLLGHGVLSSLYTALLRLHVPRGQLPSNLDTIDALLKEVFGPTGAKTITTAIARRFYEKLGIEFNEIHNSTLTEYVEIAKRKLAQG